MDAREISRRLAAKGIEHLRASRLPEALENLKLAIDHDDSNARAHQLYGTALARARGREKDALRHLERAVSLEPSNPRYKAEAAAVSLTLGMASRAARLAQEALDLDPTSTKAAQVLERAEQSEQSKPEGLLGRLRRKG